jgi:hypothetical protein
MLASMDSNKKRMNEMVLFMAANLAKMMQSQPPKGSKNALLKTVPQGCPIEVF